MYEIAGSDRVNRSERHGIRDRQASQLQFVMSAMRHFLFMQLALGSRIMMALSLGLPLAALVADERDPDPRAVTAAPRVVAVKPTVSNPDKKEIPMKLTYLAAPLMALSFAGTAMAETPNRLVTILTAFEPQTQLMAMVLTANAIAAGAEAEMLLCGPAGDIALKEAPASATDGQPPRDASPQGMMKMMMAESGLKVQVCAIYLPGKGADASILIDGVTAAAPDAMGATIVAPGTTVMSF